MYNNCCNFYFKHTTNSNDFLATALFTDARNGYSASMDRKCGLDSNCRYPYNCRGKNRNTARPNVSTIFPLGINHYAAFDGLHNIAVLKELTKYRIKSTQEKFASVHPLRLWGIDFSDLPNSSLADDFGTWFCLDNFLKSDTTNPHELIEMELVCSAAQLYRIRSQSSIRSTRK